MKTKIEIEIEYDDEMWCISISGMESPSVGYTFSGVLSNFGLDLVADVKMARTADYDDWCESAHPWLRELQRIDLEMPNAPWDESL